MIHPYTIYHIFKTNPYKPLRGLELWCGAPIYNRAPWCLCIYVLNLHNMAAGSWQKLNVDLERREQSGQGHPIYPMPYICDISKGCPSLLFVISQRYPLTDHKFIILSISNEPLQLALSNLMKYYTNRLTNTVSQTIAYVIPNNHQHPLENKHSYGKWSTFYT
jgi:hypothetical protein